MFIELIIILGVAIFCTIYILNPGENVYKFFTGRIGEAYDKFAPYSFKVVQEKVKELGQEYTFKDFITQFVLIGGFAGLLGAFYFRSIIWAAIYAGIAIMFIPYLAYLRSQRIYSEYIFECIQTYTTNVIMEFQTTQSFVKSLEGVRDSGVLDNPVRDDVDMMVKLSYQNGTIDESIVYFNERYPFYMVKNMHQLFLQITKEGARDSGEALENMSMDIDALVEGVYRDQMDRKNFYKRFIMFAVVLYFLVIALQFMLGEENYVKMLDIWYVQLKLHAIILVNAMFLLKGVKYYNEDVGVE